MMRLVMSAVLAAAVIASLPLAVSSAPRMDGPESAGLVAAQQPLTKDGWWIRVNPTNRATNLYWRFGAESNRLSAPVSWSKEKNPDEIDLPPGQRQLEAVHVAAIGLPPKEMVSFCLFFRDHGAELFEFIREKNSEVAQSQQDAACVP